MSGPSTEPPEYKPIDANPINALLTEIFLSKLEAENGSRASVRGFTGVIDTVKALSRRSKTPEELQQASMRVLDSLFPSWLPPAFAAVFSRPMPGVAYWINAEVTVWVTQWLMGKSKVTSPAIVKIERCRYLEGTSFTNLLYMSLG